MNVLITSLGNKIKQVYSIVACVHMQRIHMCGCVCVCVFPSEYWYNGLLSKCVSFTSKIFGGTGTL